MPAPTPNRRLRAPLWRVMRAAYEASSGSVVGNGGSIELPGPDCEEFAAQLRVIAHVILEAGLEGGVTGPISQWLLDEADRAELGE